MIITGPYWAILMILMVRIFVWLTRRSTLIRFRLKTHTFVCVFADRWKTDTLMHENGAFRKCLPRWRLSKTDAFRISVDGRKRRFSPTENENVSFSHVDGRKRFVNASVDADICIRFRWIKNGGIRKQISVDVALVNTFIVVLNGTQTKRLSQASSWFHGSTCIPKSVTTSFWLKFINFFFSINV